MAIKDSTFPHQDALFCDEPHWENFNQEEHNPNDDNDNELEKETSSLQHVHVTDEDLQWSNDELTTLFKKETIFSKQLKQRDLEAESAVKWMMRVVSRYGFNPTTAILAVDYIDRFMFLSNQVHRLCSYVDKVWTLQLTAVACLSLAAKVEETQAPLLLDLQTEDAKFMFEPKTIQRMELLVLSTLQWRMHPVTPFLFIDHFIRRLALKPNQTVNFLDHSSRVLTSLVTDSRWGLYPSSALAFATMLHVMEEHQEQQHEFELEDGCSNSNPIDFDKFETQLFESLISINKERVNECYKLIQEVCNITSTGQHKRKFTAQVMDSPKAVIDASAYLLTSDSSNDSWGLNSAMLLQQQPSSEELPALKRMRFGDKDDVKDQNLVLE